MHRIVLSGGPCSGKTAITSLLAAGESHRLLVVPEAATQVYTELNTRWDRLDMDGRRAVQRKIYERQIEQERQAGAAAAKSGKILLLDRGTIDGAAYWPDGPDAYWRDMHTTREKELARYDQVILLQSAAAIGVYGAASNPVRFEDAAGAVQSDQVLAALWAGHANLRQVPAHEQLEEKARIVRRLIDAFLRASQGTR